MHFELMCVSFCVFVVVAAVVVVVVVVVFRDDAYVEQASKCDCGG